MKPAQKKMRQELATVTLSKPRIPVYANVSARPVTDPEEIRAALANQICSSVLWEDTIRAMGAARYLGCGRGRGLAMVILKTLQRSASRSASSVSR